MRCSKHINITHYHANKLADEINWWFIGQLSSQYPRIDDQYRLSFIKVIYNNIISFFIQWYLILVKNHLIISHIQFTLHANKKKEDWNYIYKIWRWRRTVKSPWRCGLTCFSFSFKNRWEWMEIKPWNR